MPRTQKVEGFVLKKKTLLEKDLLVTIFTQEMGKLTVIAKGARSITSRRAAHLQTGNLITAQLSEFNERFYIQSSELVSGFMQLRTEHKLNTLYLYLYIIDKLLPEKVEEHALYNVTKRFFIALSKEEEKPSLILQRSLQQMLTQLGYIEGTYSLSALLETVENNIEEKLPRHVIM
ncbi:MAG TPA: DNA repair protein RecO [Candidatus Woesebacteria bacterium]|nr:DNA repair protein RecO [Candidatus Woesebacteria bacterium]